MFFLYGQCISTSLNCTRHQRKEGKKERANPIVIFLLPLLLHFLKGVPSSCLSSSSVQLVLPLPLHLLVLFSPSHLALVPTKEICQSRLPIIMTTTRSNLTICSIHTPTPQEAEQVHQLHPGACECYSIQVT